jgi:hypothetical protein
MIQTMTFQEYVKNELKEDDIKNKELEYDDYSMSSSDIEYTTQE